MSLQMAIKSASRRLEPNGDTVKRRLQGLSRHLIPDVVKPGSGLENLFKNMSQDARESFHFEKFSELQTVCYAGVRPNIAQSMSNISDGWTYLEDTADENSYASVSNWEDACLFTRGGVQPVRVRGLEKDGEIVPFDGNEFCILNMGNHRTSIRGSGNNVSNCVILFGWEVICHFWDEVARCGMTWASFVEGQLTAWCASLRLPDNEKLSSLLPTLSHPDDSDKLARRNRSTFGVQSSAPLTARLDGSHTSFKADTTTSTVARSYHENYWLYDKFKSACIDYKNLLNVDWARLTRCTCTFKHAGPGQIIYDNACNAHTWVSNLVQYKQTTTHATQSLPPP
jgi:hypothetical protein